MELGREERKFYENAYQKFESSRQILNEKNCFKLLERGIEDPDVCNKVRDLLFEGQKDKVLSKQEFFKLLKFIAALQNGYTIDNVSIQELRELPLPKLPKKSARETMRESKMGVSGLGLNQSETNSSLAKRNSIGEMEPPLANSGNKENKIVNHSQSDLMAQAHEMLNKRDHHEESKGESRNSRMKKSAMEELDDDLSAPIEKAVIQDVKQSVIIKDAAMLSNPFGDDFLKDSMMQSEIKKPEPEHEHEEKKNENPEDSNNHAAEEEDDDNFDKIISKKPKGDGRAYVYDPTEYNKYMENNQKIKIEIVDTCSHRAGVFGSGTYTTYKIKSIFPDKNIFETEKRFSEFDWLNNYLKNHPKYKGLIISKLPDKQATGTNTTEFIHQRKSDLESYLKHLGGHSILSEDEVFKAFLGDERVNSYQNYKDSNPNAGLGLNELDWQKMKDGFEYAKASVSTRFTKEGASFDWKHVEAELQEVFEMDNLLSETQTYLQKLADKPAKTQQLFGSKLDITSAKIMNRADDPKFYALCSLSSLFTAEIKKSSQQTPIIEDLLKEVKYFRGKIDGVKQSHGMMLSCLQQISTYQELRKTKYGKEYEYQATNDQEKIQSVSKNLDELATKIKALYEETETIRDNLSSEIKEFIIEYETCFPHGINQYYTNQIANAKNVRESSKNRYQKSEIDSL